MANIPCVGAVVFDEHGRLLLVKRANPPAQGLWSLPGGRLEAGEPAEGGVLREVLEETGLHVQVVREVGSVERTAPWGDTYVIRDFLCTGAGDVVAADDAADARFFDVAALPDLPTSEGLLEALHSWNLLPADLV
ncbi:MAG TPA: NUDIX domain-containing protein [Candidatus Nanopelagicales bacterium]|nr:NUDIX domain-containing protein [Candidatus Nanopelagicales bacterium]